MHRQNNNKKMGVALNDNTAFENGVSNEVIEYAFQIYLLGHLDEKLFIFFCLMNTKYEA